MRFARVAALLLVFAAIATSGVSQTSSENELIDGGTIVFLQGGIDRSYEFFGLVRAADGKYLLTSSLVSPQSQGFDQRNQSLLLDGNFRAREYTRSILRADGREVVFRAEINGSVAEISTRSGTEESSSILLTNSEFVVADDLAASHDIALLKRFAAAGQQVFSFDALIPSVQLVLTSTLRLAGPVTLTSAGEPFDAQEYLWEATLGGQSFVIHLYTVDGRYAADLQETGAGQPSIFFFRRDLFPGGLEIPGI